MSVPNGWLTETFLITKKSMMKTAQILFIGLFIVLMNSLSAQSDAKAFSGSTPSCPPPCPCEGGFVEMKVYYFGEDNADIEVYRNNNENFLITSFSGVNSGDLLTIDGSGLPGGTLGIYTFFSTSSAGKETCITRIYSRCPSNAWPGATDDLAVLGKTFGDYTVYAYTDSENNSECTIAYADQDWHVGGNVVEAPNNTLGTRNDESVRFITNDQVRGGITSTGEFGIATTTPDAQLDVHGDAIIEETLDVNGITRVNDVTSSTTPGNGALIVAGGAGINENVNIGNNLDVANDGHVGGSLGVNTDNPDARLDVHGNAIIESTLDVNGIARVNNGIQSFSSASGALQVAGGAGIGMNLNVGQNLDVDQNATVTGNGYFGGNLGVGTPNPLQKLHVVGNRIRLSNAGSSRYVDLRIDGAGNDINSVGQDFFIRSTNGENVYINSQPGDGRVGIGTTTIPTGYLLAVDGNVICEEVRVQLSGAWPDYVFSKNYELTPLQKVKQQIEELGHLPDSPSATEVESEGIKVSEMVTIQQKQLEELYLHVIQLSEKVEQLEAENKALKNQ